MRLWLALVMLITVVPAMPGAATITTPFSGVRYTHRTQTLPRPLSIHIVEIDLTDPDIRFLVSPKNVGSEPGENKRQTTRAFVASVQAQIGINASFFYTASSGTNVESRGLIASRGDVYSGFGELNDLTGPWPAITLSADNVATIVNRAYPHRISVETDPPIPLYNAVSGSERIVTNGRNTAGVVSYGEPTYLHPRTVIGFTANQKLVLMAVDGRQAGFSEGMKSRETADLLMQYGVIEAVNLDGGGSTTMVFADPVPRTLNKPSDGTERLVGTSLAVFAKPATALDDIVVFSDFYAGDRGAFAQPPTSAAGSQGVLASSTNEAIESAEAFERGWFQRLTIRDDPTLATVAGNPAGGWFVRHLSGRTGGPAENVERPATGALGFWARTQTPGVEVAIAIQAAGATLRAVRRELVPDGQWRLYEWSPSMKAHWQGGAAAGAGTFTVDSIHLYGPNQDAVVDLDLIAHNAKGSLAVLAPEPLQSLAPDPGAGRLVNVSVRSPTGGGERALIVGLVTGGDAAATKPVLVRAAGPALRQFGVGNALADPRLIVRTHAGLTVAQNDNWDASDRALMATTGRLGAFSFTAGSLDAATVATFPCGAYTAEAAVVGSASGVALVEIYDADENRAGAATRLLNLSARTLVGSGDDSLIAGFAIEGGPRRVLVRAIGPGLMPFGVTGVSDPQLLLYRGGTMIAYNDDWGGGATLRLASAAVGAFAVPVNSDDAALLVTLPPGSYTAVVRGASGASVSPTGVALVEVYEVR